LDALFGTWELWAKVVLAAILLLVALLAAASVLNLEVSLGPLTVNQPEPTLVVPLPPGAGDCREAVV
jgi:hypothetical protein